MTIRAIASRGAALAAVASVISMLGCSGEPPAGLYVSTCDPSMTLEFVSDTDVKVNRNYCEGYGVVDYHWELDGDEVRLLPPDGETWDPVPFVVTSEGVLTLDGSGIFITCGNCEAGDTWEKQR